MKALLTPPATAQELLSDLTDMDRNPRELGPGDEAGVRLELPEDAYFEYVWRDGEGNLQLDPDNPDSNPSVWYGQVSVLTGPEYRPDQVAVASEANPLGVLRRERLQSEALGQLRRVNTYTPAGHENTELPAILVQDGTAFNRLGRLSSALDALISQGLPAARLVYLEPVDRNSEYSFSDGYRDFVLQELLPQLPELAGPTSRVHLLGTSLGGLAAASLALAEPAAFSGVATFSGAFLGSPDNPDPYRSKDEWFAGQIRDGAPLPDRWFVGTGTLEWLHEPNLRVMRELEAAGVELSTVELSAGHNWPNWRNMTGAALRHLLG